MRDELKAGNLSVAHSKRFGHFDDFFIGDATWTPQRTAFFSRAELPSNPADVAGYLHQRLGRAYDQFLASAPQNSFATLDENGWQLSTDPAKKKTAEAQQQLKQLKTLLSRQMRPIKLPDLLIEVDNALDFTRYFAVPTQQTSRTPERVRLMLAAFMAHGCNIGPYTMAQLVQDISYRELKRISDWQLTEEAQRQALAALVNAISALDTALHWGEGRTSASDGQRFGLPRKVLQQTYSPKFSDFALEFYTFLADNYAPFYSMPIECTDRDAAFVLDGLLYIEQLHALARDIYYGRRGRINARELHEQRVGVKSLHFSFFKGVGKAKVLAEYPLAINDKYRWSLPFGRQVLLLLLFLLGIFFSLGNFFSKTETRLAGQPYGDFLTG
ncbi:MAG: Tn3 family transposase, partial [Candidatus Latescibacteria bacterium]|nr:Tn3 family transposase [Candidatus Latescibacterota bacterium]